MTITGTSILAEPPPGAHIVYPYTDDRHVIDAVSLYVVSGLNKGESVVLVMTYPHCDLIEKRLQEDGFDLRALKKSGQYICADAARTLSSFMVASQPDEFLFRAAIMPMIERARGEDGRPVRAYGEMVSLLYGTDPAAAIRLEELWNDVIKTEKLCLLCTYHLGGSGEVLATDLCEAHTHFVA